jgi:hypothetical protein
MWHDIRTKFHENLYRHSSNSKALLQKFERLKLVLLMEGIYEVRR